MSGALDQAVAGVEKLVGLPFQPDATVRAAIDVDVNLAAPAHGKEFLAVDVESTAAGIGQLNASTQKLHVYPQISPRVVANVCT
jgi:hypothetical protein